MSQQPFERYFPSLAILDTEEILAEIKPSDGWVLTKFPRRHPDLQSTDKILSPWVVFCSNALHGFEDGNAFLERGEVIINEAHIRSYLLFTEALGEESGTEEIITSVQNAFAQLLSEQAKEQLQEIMAVETVVVDDNLRSTVSALVTNMYTLALRHEAEVHAEWKRFDGDDD